MTELSCRWAAGPFLARCLLALGILLALLVAPGCGQGQAASRPEEGSARDWPFSVVSTEPRFRVFYDSPADRGTAEHVASSLRDAWVFQTRVLGFTNPPSDGGIVGPDDWFDVFLVRGIDSCKVDIASPEPVTPWGGLACYMQLDPWGKYGGEGLAQTVAHEFNHATQAADAWNDMPIIDAHSLWPPLAHLRWPCRRREEGAGLWAGPFGTGAARRGQLVQVGVQLSSGGSTSVTACSRQLWSTRSLVSRAAAIRQCHASRLICRARPWVNR